MRKPMARDQNVDKTKKQAASKGNIKPKLSELKTHLYILYQFILGLRLRFFDKPMYTQFQKVSVDSEAIADVSKRHPRLLRKLASFHLVSLEQVTASSPGSFVRDSRKLQGTNCRLSWGTLCGEAAKT